MEKSLVLQKIKELKLKEAKKEIEYLKKQGENVTSLENKFNKAVKEQKHNIEEKFVILIKKNLKDNNLKEVLKIQKKLHTIGIKTKKLDKIIELANQKLLKIELKEHKEQIDEFKEEIRVFLEKNQYNELMQRTYKFIKSNKWTHENHYDLQLLKEVKRKIIDDKYKDNHKKLKQHTIVTQFEFIKKLFLIDESYPFAQKLLYKYQKKLAKYDSYKKKIIRREALINLRVIYNQKNYENAIQKAFEFLKTQPNQKRVINFIKKAKRKIQLENYKISFQKVIKNQKQNS
ncbi:hypothetical protein CL656_01220 [bacterium]|nr:hypothetical protein [bacterium]|tara:strand:- start:1687 stop:2550 length:864 start_codon:yes stop_codon:yes gene_type:complete